MCSAVRPLPWYIFHTFCGRSRQVLRLRFATAHASEVAEKRTSNRINRTGAVNIRTNQFTRDFVYYLFPICKQQIPPPPTAITILLLLFFSAICVAQYDTMQVVRKVADMKIGSHTHTHIQATKGDGKHILFLRWWDVRTNRYRMAFSANNFFFSLVGRLFIHCDVYVSVDPQDRVILFIYV